MTILVISQRGSGRVLGENRYLHAIQSIYKHECYRTSKTIIALWVKLYAGFSQVVALLKVLFYSKEV